MRNKQWPKDSLSWKPWSRILGPAKPVEWECQGHRPFSIQHVEASGLLMRLREASVDGPQGMYMHSDGPPMTCIPFTFKHSMNMVMVSGCLTLSPALAGSHQCLVTSFSLLPTILSLMQFLNPKTCTFGLGTCKAQIQGNMEMQHLLKYLKQPSDCHNIAVCKKPP